MRPPPGKINAELKGRQAMLLNQAIWQATIAAALTLVGETSAWGRAIKRGAKEVERSAYWNYSAGKLTLRSTTSGKTYNITRGDHRCEATEKSGACCKHNAALRLLERYTERLQATEVACNTCQHVNWSCLAGHEVVTTKTQTITPRAGQQITKRAQRRQTV